MMPRPKQQEEPPAAVEPLPPRFAAGWAALVYAMCTLVLAYPVFGGAFLVNQRSDQFIAGYAFRDFAATSLRSGHGFPQWNPFLYGGLPYIAAMHGDIFYPTFLLRMILHTDQAMTWGFIIHLFLAGVFTYGFLRAWGLGFYASLFGGLAYMLGGNIAGLASPGHDGKLFVSGLFPLSLWMLVRGVRDGRAWAWGGFAFAVGMAVLSPHPQLLQYMLLGAGAFALFLALAPNEGGPPLDRRIAVQRLGLAFAAVIVAALIGAVQYLPVREYVSWSPRAGGQGYDFATTYSLPIEELIDTYLPQFSGILDRYWGRNGIHLHSEYVGVVVLILAGAAFGVGRRRGFRWFWLCALIVSLLWALGGNTPFYQLVYAVVPGTKFFRAPSTMLFLVAFSVAVLSALGVERILERAMSARFLGGWLIGAAVVAIVASAGGFAGVAQVVVSARAAATAPPEQQGATINFLMGKFAENATAVTAGSWRCFLIVAIACALLYLHRGEKLGARALAWSLIALTAIDLLSIARLYWIFSPPAATLFAADAATDYLKKAAPGRVWAIQLAAGAAERDPYLGVRGGGEGDGLMVHGIRVVTGYHGNELGRYQQLTRGGETAVLAHPEFWRHENVRYLYTNGDDSTVARLFAPLHLAAPMTRLVGPVKNSAGSTVYVYRLPGDNPAAWVTPVIVKAPDDVAVATVLDPGFDPGRAAIVDTGSAIRAQVVQTLPTPVNIGVRVARYEPGHITLQLDTPAPSGSGLVVSENYYPGWRATTDGKSASVDRADYNLIGIQLATGARTVDLAFADPAYAVGGVATLVGLLIAAAGTILGVLADRRRPATFSPG